MSGDNEGILQEQDREWAHGTSSAFKYANMGSAGGVLNKILQLLRGHKQVVCFSVVFLLILIGFFVDIGQNKRLSRLEGEHDYIRDWFEYDYSSPIDSDFMVNIDVIAKYERICSPFFCPVQEMCYCLSEQFANFQAANRTCVEVLSGELVQFKNSEQEDEFIWRLWRKTYRKRAFWIGATKTKDSKKPEWINCSECEDMATLDSHEKKIENITQGDHSCLMMTEGLLQQYPCTSPRLRSYEKKYINNGGSSGKNKKTPYWFEEDVVAESYGLYALCQCPAEMQAKQIESDTSPFVCKGYYYTLSKKKYLDQSAAAEACEVSSECYLVSFNSIDEQRCVAGLSLFKSASNPMVWVGGKKIEGPDSSYRWSKTTCQNQNLDMSRSMEPGTACYALGDTVAGSDGWSHVIHARSCEDFQSFACQINTHKMKAATAATDKQISLKLIEHLGNVCEMVDCYSSTKCYCTLSGRDVSDWRNALLTCGTQDMDLVVVSDEREFEFLTSQTDMSIRGYVAAYDFHDEKKLTWVNEMGDQQAQTTVDDDVIISNWTDTSGGCLYLKKGDPPFVFQNCEVPGAALCEFDVSVYNEKWQQKQDDYA